MDADRLAALKHRLLAARSTDNPSEVRDVMEELALDDSPPPQRLLLEIFSSNGDKGLSGVLLRVLGDLASRGVVQPIYELWWACQDPRLTELLTEEGWIPEFSSHVQVIRDLESGRIDSLAQRGADVVGPLIKAAGDGRPTIRESALKCLSSLQNADAVDVLCASWAENRLAVLGELIERCGYVARRPAAARLLSALEADRLELVSHGAAEVVKPLAKACSDEDSVIARRAISCLAELKDPQAVDALLEIWAHHRAPELDSAVERAGYVAEQPLINKVLSALKCSREDLLVAEGPAVVQPLVVALDDRDPMIAERAGRLLEEMLEANEFQDALCRAVIEHGLPRAQEIALSKACKPIDVRYRALFYFLTEQWELYEGLDFDLALLSEHFEHGGKGLRSRIADTARRSGRLELVELVAGVRHRRRMGEMTIREWEVTLAILDDRRDWETMWRLAQSAPAVWAAGALCRLAEVGWRPGGKDELQGFDDLLGLSRRLRNEAPILGMIDRPTARFRAHGRRVSRLIVNSYFDRTLASASWDGTVRVWSMPDGKPLSGLAAHRHPVTALAASPDGSVLVTGSGAEERVIVWTMPEATPIKTLPGHSRGVSCLSMGPDGRLVAAGGYDGACRLWRLRDAALLAETPASSGSLRCVAFSPDGTVVATGGEDSVVRLWRAPSGEHAAELRGHTMTVRSLAFTPDGGLLASAGSDNDILLWDVPTGRQVGRMGDHTNVVTSLAISGDGRILASAGWDRTVRMWVLPEAKAWGKLEEHTGPVTCLATDPESRMLVSGSHDCTVIMWNFQSGIFRRPTTRPDMERIESLIDESADNNEKTWLDFLLAQMKWRWRFDIELDAAPSSIEVGEFDIEV